MMYSTYNSGNLGWLNIAQIPTPTETEVDFQHHLGDKREKKKTPKIKSGYECWFVETKINKNQSEMAQQVKVLAAKSADLSSSREPTGLHKDSHKLSSDMHRLSYQFMKNIQSSGETSLEH